MGDHRPLPRNTSSSNMRPVAHHLLTILLVITTNLFTLYVFSSGSFKLSSPSSLSWPAHFHSLATRLSYVTTTGGKQTVISSPLSGGACPTLVSHHNQTHREVKQLRAELSELKKELLRWRSDAANSVGTKTSLVTASLAVKPATDFAVRLANMPKELKEFVAPQKLPLGQSPSLNTDKLTSPIGHPCANSAETANDLSKYMSYQAGKVCPDDQALAQKLVLAGCEPLPRRRCFAKTSMKLVEPYPLPKSLWSTPSDDSILWTPYTCKSFQCLIERKKLRKQFEDCMDCFDLQGREKTRWLTVGSSLDLTIDDVLGLKKGKIRIGLDIGGGTGTFAARMQNKNVTIITTTMNLNGPFSNFVASRGVVPLFLSISQRFPFFDNTLDLVHSMHVLSNWIPLTTLEFILFDIDRVLRPGGLFWLDHFFCLQDQLQSTYLPLINKLGYKKLKWAVGAKLDRGPDVKEVYLTAVLEKPLHNNNIINTNTNTNANTVANKKKAT